ncbi:MAG TPA: CpsD/CapB family tyrosine-protein kinase [Polyangia bacterium]|jgi:Mrp family chromosome partitioning ATPase|nr:CpsD/CapB family tyrosine-protein kinase [Polyangia bacterium]
MATEREMEAVREEPGEAQRSWPWPWPRTKDPRRDGASARSGSDAAARGAANSLHGSRIGDTLDPRVVVMSRPTSAVAEQYRLLALGLEGAVRSGKRRMAFTSAAAGEGRTLCAINTAFVLGCERHYRVTLVDCDFRMPTVHRVLGIEPEVGLGDVLEGRAELQHTMWRFGDHELWIVPAGRVSAPHAAVTSRRLGDVIGELLRQSDIVLIDAPPVLPLADVAALGRHVDGAVMAIRAGRTRREIIDMALDALALAEVDVLGAVLVGIEAEAGTAYQLCVEHDRRQRALPPHVPQRAGASEPKELQPVQQS